MKLLGTLVAAALLFTIGATPMAGADRATKNSWRGITPLQSSVADVARVLGIEADINEGVLSGPFKVDGGEVTFSYLTPSLARVYRAPRSMVGKVFTIYYKPSESLARADLKLAPGFKRCSEETDKTYYYLVSDVGLAYQVSRTSDGVETIIYQPSRAAVRQLAVNTACVF